jgi:hypothetical protein
MPDENKRPDSYIDVLNTMKLDLLADDGNPFEWERDADGKYKDQTYANLKMRWGIAKPPEPELTAELAEMQAAFDAADYSRNRAAAYPSLADQNDMQYHDAIDGTTTWADAIAAVKAKYPKA